MTWWWPLRWILSLALLAAALGALGVMGNGVLAPPPLSVDGGREWLTQREAVVVAFAVVRLVALGVGGYLFAAVAVSGVVRIIDERRGGRLFDRLTLGAARGLIGTIGLGAVAVTAAPAASAQVPSSSTAVIREIGATPVASGSHATIRQLPDAPPRPPVGPAEPARQDEQWSVGEGESLWSIAASHLQDITGRDDLSEAEIASYWRQVVEANPTPNPDLLFVGQTVVLPAVTTP